MGVGVGVRGCVQRGKGWGCVVASPSHHPDATEFPILPPPPSPFFSGKGRQVKGTTPVVRAQRNRVPEVLNVRPVKVIRIGMQAARRRVYPVIMSRV